MATRTRSRKKEADERYYPIRIRIRVPDVGFGRAYETIHAWLDKHAGRGQWGWNADSVLSRRSRDAVSVYLCDPSLANSFIEEFRLELAIGDPELCGEGSFRLIKPLKGASG